MSIVAIDPGHGGADSGATAGKLREADLTLEHATELGMALARRGHQVILTRHGDTTVSLSERARMANAAQAVCFISVHINASDNPTARGPWSIHAKGSERGRKLATACQKSLAGALDGNPKAVYPDGSEWVGNRTLAVLRQTKMPAVLLELGFITNAEDRKALQDDSVQKCVAEALAAAIEGELT